MGTWRNSNPHPPILPTGYKPQSQRDHPLPWVGPAWSHVTLPQLLPRILQLLAPSSGSGPQTPPKQPSLTHPPTLPKAMHPQFRASHPKSRLAEQPHPPKQPLGSQLEAIMSPPSPPEPSHPLPPLPQGSPGTELGRCLRVHATWACEDLCGSVELRR